MSALEFDVATGLAALGWSLILAGFLSGTVLGLAFHRDEFLGGYTSLRRRLVRLGHIACVALGVIMLEFASSRAGRSDDWVGVLASAGFAIGGVSMPLACFAVAWRARLRLLFALPVVALTTAAASTLYGVLR